MHCVVIYIVKNFFQKAKNFSNNFYFWSIYLFIRRQAMYVYRNIEACLCNHCCNGKAVNITYYECVFVVLRLFILLLCCTYIIRDTVSLNTAVIYWCSLYWLTSMFIGAYKTTCFDPFNLSHHQVFKLEVAFFTKLLSVMLVDIHYIVWRN
jgi:hypothetical protein